MVVSKFLNARLEIHARNALGGEASEWPAAGNINDAIVYSLNRCTHHEVTQEARTVTSMVTLRRERVPPSVTGGPFSNF